MHSAARARGAVNGGSGRTARTAAQAAIDALRRDGMDTLADIARRLNQQRVPTLSGRGASHGAQVARAEGKRPR